MGEMYIQITGLMAIFWACNAVTKYAYHHTASSTVDSLIMALLCYFVVPFLTLININNDNFAKLWHRKRTLRRYKIPLFTIIEGILSGYFLSDRRHQQISPCIWLVPLGIALATNTECFNFGACQDKLLFVTITQGIINELVFGLFVGITFSYICISLIYSTIGFFAVRFYLQRYRDERVSH